jgi:hypothetical protein
VKQQPVDPSTGQSGAATGFGKKRNAGGACKENSEKSNAAKEHAK